MGSRMPSISCARLDATRRRCRSRRRCWRAGWQLSGAARGVPWARNARGLVVSTNVAVAVVAPVSARIEHGKNLAGEPRDDITLDLELDARFVADAPMDAGAAVV